MTARFAYIVSDNILPLPLSFFEQYVNDNAAQQQGAIKKGKAFFTFPFIVATFSRQCANRHHAKTKTSFCKYYTFVQAAAWRRKRDLSRGASRRVSGATPLRSATSFHSPEVGAKRLRCKRRKRKRVAVFATSFFCDHTQAVVLAEKEGFVPRRKPKGKRSNTVAERYVISFSRSRSETTALQKEKKKKGCRFCNLFLLRPHASSRFGGERGI